MVNRCLLLLLGVLWVWSAAAQNVPQGFNYQCIVRDNTGASINNQTVTLLFTIRNNAPNGPIAYSEMHTTSTNAFGLVNLAIGAGTPLQGNFANINWGVGAKFLTVSVETSPNVFDEIGTSQLLSVPYALYAQNAANSGDNWGSQVVQTSAELSGNGTAASPLGLSAQGAQPGQVLKWNGSAWVPQDDNVGQSGTVTEVNTGVGLTGGPITTTGTISLANAPVIPGLYGGPSDIPVITVDQYGRVINATTVPVVLTTINAGAGINVSQSGQTFTITNIGDVNPADDLTTSSVADGDVAGPFSNLQLKTGVVGPPELADGAVTSPKLADAATTTAKLADGAVNTSKLANGAVTGAKLNDMGAAPGQVLKWNGTTWAPAADATGPAVTLNAGPGIGVQGAFPNFTINNLGDVDPNDDITATSIADGDVAGPFVNLQIKPGAVGSIELANNAVTTLKINAQAVTGDKIDQMSATVGQVLKWNGTTWAPAPDNVGSVTITGGLGIDVTATGQNFVIANTGDINPFDDITTTSIANGDVTGPFSDLQLKAGVVGSIELASNAVQTSKIQDGAVTAAKLNNMGASNGQVLKWNGTSWAPANDLGPDNWGSQTAVVSARLTGNGTSTSPLDIAQMGATPGQVLKWNGSTWAPDADASGNNYAAGTGISITGTAPNFTITNTGDTDPTDDITTASTAGGDVTGPFSNLQIAPNAVGTPEIANGAVTGAKINDMGAANGQTLKWNGSTWAPADDNSGNNYAAGTGISITGTAPNFTITNTGDTDPTDDITTASTAGGDVTGPFSNLQIAPNAVGTPEIANGAVTGAKINDMGANAGDVLKWNGTSWAPADATIYTALNITGNGSAGNPLRLNDLGATDGQVLVWNSMANLWTPANDTWGTQVAQTDATLAGNGTATSPLKIAQQGAAVGQVLKWNGTSWVPDVDAVASAGTGDNWGTQTVIADNTLDGDGTGISPLRIAQQGATPGQVLKWNGSTWAPDADASGNSYAAGTGISITGTAPNFTITNTGDTDPTDDITTASTAGGDVTGPFSNLQIAPNAVGTPEIANGAVTGAKINDMGAANGQTLKWNGSTWAPADDNSGNNYAAGTGISITGTAPNFTITNTGDTDPTDDITTASTAGGDVTGPFSNLQIAPNAVGTPEIADGAVTGAKINDMGAANGQTLKWNGSTWAPADDNSGNNYAAGTGISITGTAPNFTINNTGDSDNDATNELQTLALNGTQLSISGTGSTVSFDTLFNNAGIGLWTASGTDIYNSNTGNVGVGTTMPLRPLHVKGGVEVIRVEGTEPGIGFAVGAKLASSITQSTGFFTLATQDSSSIVMATGAGKVVFVDGQTGHVGMGATAHPIARLRVSHATGFAGLMIENSNSGWNWDFRVNPATGALELYNNFLGGVGPVGTFQTNGSYVPSDKRLKKDIQAVGSILDKVISLQPVYYRYRNESATAKRSVGFLAQDVEALFPELVSQTPMPDGTVYLGLNYAGFGVLAIQAIQEQQREIEALRQKNTELEQRLNALEVRLLRLEQTSAKVDK